jgi:hypothetical protein
MLLVKSSSATCMPLACVADENCLLLDAVREDVSKSSCIPRSGYGHNSPVMSLCSCWTRVYCMAVVYASTDGEALDDLDTHGRNSMAS